MKEKALLTYLFATMLLITASCRHESSTTSQLQMLDTLVEVAPDSVFRILSQQNTSTYSQANLMHAELLRAKAMNKADILFTTDSTLIQVSAYYDKHGTPNQQMLSHYLLGRAYSDMGSAPRAIESFHEAAERADTTSADCDYGTLLRVHSQLSDMYGKLLLTSNDIEECYKAKHYAQKIGDNDALSIFDYTIINELYSNKKYNECIEMARKILDKNKTEDKLSKSSYIALTIVKSYIATSRYDSVSYYLNLYKNYLETYSNIKIYGDDTALSYYQGKMYLGQNKLDSALSCFHKIDSCSLQPELKALFYGELSKTYRLLNMPDSALKYILLYTQINDSCYDSSITSSCLNVKHLYDYNIERRKADIKTVEALRLREFLQLCFIGVALLVILIIFLMYKNTLSHKRMVELMYEHQTSIAQLHNIETEIAYLSSEKQEIEELLSKEEGKTVEQETELSQLAKEIEQKTLTITAQREKIQSLEAILNKGKNTDKNILFYNSEIVNRFHRAITSRGYTIKDED